MLKGTQSLTSHNPGARVRSLVVHVPNALGIHLVLCTAQLRYMYMNREPTPGLPAAVALTLHWDPVHVRCARYHLQ